jgi:uncharacterized tellurite resistance protein B-like protein
VLDAIRDLFRKQLAANEAAPLSDERTLQLAAATLLFEVARADGVVKPEERTVMQAAVQGTFGLSADETQDLVRLAEAESRSAPSLFQFTVSVDAALSAEEKKRVVELLWLVAFADADKQAEEEHLVRKIAGLLHVPHPDFIDAKIRARGAHPGA